MTEREQFEAALSAKPEARYWNTTDAMYWAWQAARAQPAQAGAEPVAWGMQRPDGLILDVICPEEHEAYEGEYTTPLYTRPPARVPLTDEELRMISKQQDPVVVLHHNVLAFAHAVIAAYEAKNGIGGGK